MNRILRANATKRPRKILHAHACEITIIWCCGISPEIPRRVRYRVLTTRVREHAQAVETVDPGAPEDAEVCGGIGGIGRTEDGAVAEMELGSRSRLGAGTRRVAEGTYPAVVGSFL